MSMGRLKCECVCVWCVCLANQLTVFVSVLSGFPLWFPVNKIFSQVCWWHTGDKTTATVLPTPCFVHYFVGVCTLYIDYYHKIFLFIYRYLFFKFCQTFLCRSDHINEKCLKSCTSGGSLDTKSVSFSVFVKKKKELLQLLLFGRVWTQTYMNSNHFTAFYDLAFSEFSNRSLLVSELALPVNIICLLY